MFIGTLREATRWRRRAGGFRPAVLPEWLRVRWNMSLASERPERDTLDNRTLPQVELRGSAAYYITMELNNEIVGGRCTLGMQVVGGPSITYPFSIRGKNPLDATARAYITANVDEEFQQYAWMIAKHESKYGNRARISIPSPEIPEVSHKLSAT